MKILAIILIILTTTTTAKAQEGEIVFDGLNYVRLGKIEKKKVGSNHYTISRERTIVPFFKELFPNPAFNYIVVPTLTNELVQIFDTKGRLIKKAYANNGRVELNRMSSGMYLLSVAGEKSGYKFLKL